MRGKQGTALAELDDDELTSSPAEEAAAEAYEARARAEAHSQFKKLKQASQANFGVVNGNPGLKSVEKWAELLEEAGDEIGNGHFLVRMLGAERYLDPKTVAVLLTLRQNLVSEQQNITAADLMIIDAAVLAYFNMFRVQGWIGNSALVIEADFFGKDLLSEVHGDVAGKRLEEQIRRLSDVILSLQEKANKMMVRNLAELRARTGPKRKAL